MDIFGGSGGTPFDMETTTPTIFITEMDDVDVEAFLFMYDNVIMRGMMIKRLVFLRISVGKLALPTDQS